MSLQLRHWGAETTLHMPRVCREWAELLHSRQQWALSSRPSAPGQASAQELSSSRACRVYREWEELPHSQQDPGAYREDKRWMWALRSPIPEAAPSQLLAHTALANQPECQGVSCALRNLALPF